MNKSGTRFIPKIRQRRAAATLPTPASTQVTATLSSQGPSVSETTTTKEVIIPSRDEPHIKLSESSVDLSKTALSPENSSGQFETDGPSILSPPATQNPIDNGTDTASPPTINHSREPPETKIGKTFHSSGTQQHSPLRPSRLSSLSESISSGSFTETLRHAPNTSRRSSTVTSPRLPTLSLATSKKNPVSATYGKNDRDDVNLNSLKRRRMVVNPRVSGNKSSKMGATPFKISVASSSKIAVPTYNNSSDEEDSYRNSRGGSGSGDDNGNYMEIYTIKSSSEIPRYIEDKDSARYRVDETAFTLEELCRPNLPIGELSENYERAQQAKLKRLQKRKERRLLRARARVERKSMKSLTEEDEKMEIEERKKAAESLLNADVPEATRPQQAIQLKLSADGTLVVDEESTIVDRHKNASIENSHKVKVDEDQFENLYNYATYGKSTYSEHWTPDELAKFYRALAMWGTDFNLIAQLYPHRTRTQIRAKFNSENRKHPLMIDLALRAKLPPDFEGFCSEIGKSIGTIEEFNAKIEALQSEHKKEMEALKQARENAILEDFKETAETEGGSLGSTRAQGLNRSRVKSHRDEASAEVILGTIDDVRRQREEAMRLKKEEEEQEQEERKPLVKRESRVRRLQAESTASTT